MNNKKNLLALALSASFVLGTASISHAEEASPSPKAKEEVLDQVANSSTDQGSKIGDLAKDEDRASISRENDSQLNSASNKEASDENKKEEDKNLQKATDPNYGEDEKQINDYGKERYKETDLQPGDTNQSLVKTDEKVEKDGFKFEIKNPSETSPSKTEYGYEITIDKKTGQRTYTRIDVTDGGKILVDPGNKPMMGQGDKLTPESPGVTYKPNENTELTASVRQRNLNYEASKETLEHINNKDNESTSFGFKDNYTQDNPKPQFFGSNFVITYKVNPWPNENDKLEELKLNKNKYNADEKYFVKGQEFDTGIKVDNIDESAKERLVGQVYNPNTGKIVPGARAYIGDNGNIFIKMPEGAINEDGTVNKDSIFVKDPDYRAIQNLDVKFFARPRTADEFKAIADTGEDEYEKGTYVETGAGTASINHKGKDVTIDKQGIDRYDHYNLIGNFKLNLDDTKFYNQKYKDQNGDPTKDHVFSKIEPGREFSINMESEFGKNNENKEEFDKTPEEMKAAQERKEAAATANLQFFLENNKDKEGNLKPEDERWKLSIGGKEVDLTTGEKEINVDNLSNLKITAPSTAKAGEFVAIPVEYTYTNGSKDVHWFHFVVQESDNNIPTYESEAGIADKKLSKKPEISQSEKDLKKNQPKSYKLAKTEYKDDKGNVWNVSIDETTGEVTATVPDNANIPEGGAKLNVDVIVTYEEKVTLNGKEETRTYTEKTKAQFYSIPETKQEVKKTFETDLPYKTTWKLDPDLPAGKVVEEGGEVGKQNLVFSQIVVGNKKGALDENGNFVEGKELLSKEIVTPAVDKVIKIGTKPLTTDVIIPRGLEYELDYSRKDGEPEVVEDGSDGVVTITTSQDPTTGEITINKTTKNAQPKKIKIPAGTEGTHEYTEKKPFTYDIQFDKDFYKNYPDAKENFKIVTDGKVGEKVTKWKIENSKIVGKPEIIKDTEPTNAVIKVGQKDYTGTITHTENHEVAYEVEYKYSDELEAGQTKVEQKGEKGSYDVEYSQKIKNGEKDGELTSTKKNEKAAKKEIIVIGTKPLTKVVEKPFNTEYVYDENLEAGKTEEVTPGKNGKVTITTSYDKDQKKVVTSETEEKGQNRVVKIGGKTNGTEKITEEIPFEVEVKKDPSLKKGEWKYAKDEAGNELKGEKGEEEKTLTIVNSKVTETSEPNVTKKAKKAVILVGDEDFTGKIESVDKDPIPFETEVIVDPSLKPGEIVEDQKGELGQQETELTRDIKNGIAGDEVRGKTTRTKEPVTRKIRVGAKSDGTHTYTGKKPFDVEVRVNPELRKGQHKVIQKGVEGEEEYTVTIENSKVTKTSDPKETKAPVKEIIEVGSEDFTGTFESKKTKAIEFETEYIVDNSMEPGTTKVEQEGELGEEETTVTHTIVNGQVTESEEGEAKQTKAPVKRIVKVGPAKTDGTHTYTNKKPFEVEVRVNPELKKGEHKVIQKGVEGEEEYTVTIENSKVTKTSDPKETKAPVKEIIEVGGEDYTGEVSHTENFKTAYGVEIRYNDQVPAGQTKVIQEGEEGSYDITYTQKIKNGQADGALVKSDKQNIKKAKNHIIEVGTNSKTCPVIPGTETPVNKEVPVEIEYVYDNTKEKGYVEKGEVTPGSVETKVISKVENGKVVNTEQTVVKAAKQKIIIGTKDFEGNFTYKDYDELGYDTEIIYDENLEFGKTVVDQEGENGQTEKTVSQKVVNGKLGEKEISEPKVIKEAKNKKIRIGIKPITKEVELKNEVVVKVNPELKEGETKVIEPGKPGKLTITTSFDKENNKVITTEKTEKPQDKVIEVGLQSDGTHKYKERTPFDTEIIYDDTLELGKSEVVREGKTGLTETVVTIKDSKLTESTPSVIEKPINKVIKIGTKTPTPAESIVEKKVKTEVEYVFDNTKEKGYVEEIESTDGSVKTVVESKVVDGKVVNIEKTLVRPGTKKILVGTKDFTGKYDYEKTCPISPRVIVRENPDMEAGTSKVVQEGKDGSQKTHVSVDIKNGKVVKGSIKETPGEKKDPVDHIIELGTKKTQNTCPIPEKPSESNIQEAPKEDNQKHENPKQDKPSQDNKKGEYTSKSEDTSEPKEKELTGEVKVHVPKESPKRLAVGTNQQRKDITNPKTGIAGLGNVLAGLGVAVGGLFTSKKKKEDK